MFQCTLKSEQTVTSVSGELQEEIRSFNQRQAETPLRGIQLNRGNSRVMGSITWVKGLQKVVRQLVRLTLQGEVL